MASGWAPDGAVQDQIDDTITEAVMRARARMPTGEAETHCHDCNEPIPQARRELKAELTPKGRAELYAAMTKLEQPAARPEVAFGDFRFDFRRHLREVEARIKELIDLTQDVDDSADEPRIKGTRIEVHRLAALLDGGMTPQAVLRDYPSMSERQLMAAKAYAEMNPKAGRPYPAITAKAAMRGSGLDALDDDD